MHPSQKCGFTLIELLVVVTLIAILTALAAVNLLAAQTRSKVARVRADLRVVGMALETYVADHNTFPDTWVLDPAVHQTRLGLIDYHYARAALTLLSTPVPYLSNPLVPDLFGTVEQIPLGPEEPPQTPPYCMGYMNTQAMLALMPGTGGLNSLRDGMVPQSWIDSDLPAFLAHRWVLQSVGPDRKNFPRQGTHYESFPKAYLALTNGKENAYFYDPTNGTDSAGDIVLTGKGVGR